MRGAFSLKRLAAALLLAMAAFLAPTGNASAHQGHSSSPPIQKHVAAKATADGRSVRTELRARADVESVDRAVGAGGVLAFMAVHVLAGLDPCSDDGRTAHSTGCCTVACHGAVAAPAPLVMPGCAPPSVTDGHPDQVLSGLSGDRNERPPKLG